MASIQIQNLTKTFDDGLTAVNNLNLDIQDGEFVVFVGPSGCGKSTTLRMIAGLEKISSGTISIGDRVVNTVAPKDRDIAMVFQNYALYPHLSVEENMGFALRMSKMPKDHRQARVREAHPQQKAGPTLRRTAPACGAWSSGCPQTCGFPL